MPQVPHVSQPRGRASAYTAGMRSVRVAVMVLAGWGLGCGGGLDDDGPPPDDAAVPLCPAKHLAPWTRSQLGVGGVVTFDEVMYHPIAVPAVEWVELYNPMAIDVDLSGFRIDGAIHYAFAEGTRIGPGGFLVVASSATMAGAIGPFTGALPDDGGALELWNNAGRLLDTVRYDDGEPWPVSAAGSGASLAKRVADSASEAAEAWTASARVGGTPGAVNVPAAQLLATTRTLVPTGARWRYQATGATPAAGWAGRTFDDASWADGAAPFYTSAGPLSPMTAVVTFTADNYVAVYAGKADGSGLRLIGRDAVGDWTSAESLTFMAVADEYLYLAAWETPGDSGGPQMLIGQVAFPDGTLLATDATTFEWTLGPVGASPGGALTDLPPALAQIQGVIAAASWAAPQAVASNDAGPWGGALAGQFAPAAHYVWADRFDDPSITNTSNTYVLFRSKRPIVPPPGATAIARGPITTYYRTHLQVADGLTAVQTWLEHLVDDGAIFYLDGVELLRVRMAAGPVGPTTLAATTVGDATASPPVTVDGHGLTAGDHVLAVEVHQAIANDADLRFDGGLRASMTVTDPGAAPSALAFNELGGADPDRFWVELTNLGGTAIDVGGLVIRSSAGGEHVLAVQPLAPGALLLLSQAELGFGAAADDKLFLYPADRGAVLDGVRVGAVPRGRHAPALDWRYPDVATPGTANVFVDHDEVVIDELLYHAPPVVAGDGAITKSSLEWIELHNRSAAPIDLGGWQLVDAVAFEIPAGATVAAGGYLVVTSDVAGFQAAYPGLPATVLGEFTGGLADGGDNLVLLDACGNPADGVRYSDGGRWPTEADGGGASLELKDERADHGAAEAWAASDQARAATWQTITYEGVAAPSAVGPDGQWQELVIGLLDAGVVLIDDVSVVVDPATAPVELIDGGNFEAGGAAFRLLGNHRHSEVVVDPTDPANHVLRLVATGATEHMHNHLETTLTGSHRIASGRTYRISLRARWQAGVNLLNTRLYFDRLPRTTALTIPGQPGTPGAANSRAAANLGPTYRDLRHTPAVPAAGEPVEVSVTAADPDGVTGLTLWTAADGGAAQRVAMTDGGGGRYSAMVPGRSAASVVQFWITGQDARGAATSFPAAGPASRALWKVDDGLAATNGLHNLRVIMTPADAAWLFDGKNLMSNDPVGATVIYDEREVTYDVGVRLKGSERGRPVTQRIGFGLSFPADQPFRGILRGVLVDRSQGVGYGQRELLFFQAMNHAGAVPSQYDDLIKILPPRADIVGAAHLQLARFGSQMLDFQFDHGNDGTLFEYELIYYPTTTDSGTPTGNKLPAPDSVVGTAIRGLGDDEEAYRLSFINKNNRWRDDYRGLIRFAKVFGQSGAAFDSQVATVIDVDQWLRAFAIGTLSGAVDNYSAGSQHNADFYLRPDDGRALYFPHDLDFLGGSRGPVVGSGDLAKLIAVPERSRAYYGHLYDIITSSYNGPYMMRWTDQLGALLPGQNFAGHLAFIIDRAEWVMNLAPNAVTKAIPRAVFQISTNGGAALTVPAATVDLDGTGWVDVRQVMRAGNVLPLTVAWPTTTTWRATLDLVCGPNAIELDAVDGHGQAVGTDTIAVTRTGVGCP